MKENILITIISSIFSGIVGTIVGAILTHFLYWSKLKKEQKSKILGVITQERVEAVKKIKFLITKLNALEYTNICHPEFEYGVTTYPYIFNNWETMQKFIDEYREIRKETEELLDIKCFLYLLIGDKYLMGLQKQAIYIKDDTLYQLGIILQEEIDKWWR